MIKDLEKKLNGEIPVTREELIELIDSWGRTGSVSSIGNNFNNITINESEPTKKYDLSKVDVSEIDSFNEIFAFSLFDGDVSKWDTSNVTSMRNTLHCAKKFNHPLPWNTSNVTSMSYMLYGASNFNQPLNFNTPNLRYTTGMFWFANSFEHPIDFDISNLRDHLSMLDGKAFIEKFNNGERIENSKEWIEQNRDKMKSLSISENDKSELDSLFDEIEDSLKINNKNIYN